MSASLPVLFLCLFSFHPPLLYCSFCYCRFSRLCSSCCQVVSVSLLWLMSVCFKCHFLSRSSHSRVLICSITFLTTQWGICITFLTLVFNPLTLKCPLSLPHSQIFLSVVSHYVTLPLRLPSHLFFYSSLTLFFACQVVTEVFSTSVRLVMSSWCVGFNPVVKKKKNHVLSIVRAGILLIVCPPNSLFCSSLSSSISFHHYLCLSGTQPLGLPLLSCFYQVPPPFSLIYQSLLLFVASISVFHCRCLFIPSSL